MMLLDLCLVVLSSDRSRNFLINKILDPRGCGSLSFFFFIFNRQREERERPRLTDGETLLWIENYSFSFLIQKEEVSTAVTCLYL